MATMKPLCRPEPLANEGSLQQCDHLLPSSSERIVSQGFEELFEPHRLPELADQRLAACRR